MRGSFHGRALGALALCLVLASATFMAGCGHGGSILPGIRWERGGSKATEQEIETYARAVGALKAGRYEQASRLFNDVFVTTEDMELAGRSRYGQAIARLGAARSTSDYRQAMDVWDSWSQGWPTPEACPDPNLVAPLLPRLTPGQANDKSPSSFKDIEALELQAGELSRQLDEARRENEGMRAKIKALEELHQDMQRRQKKLISQ